MSIYPSRNNLRNISLILFILCAVSLLFAQETNLNSPENQPAKPEENLTELQKQARQYRAQGLELQRMGNLDGAMSLYQKVIQLDPLYTVAYNDLGIIYEAKGLFERAEESYLKAIKIDPFYLSAYTNLALLNENKRNFNKAYFYWQKRAELGSPDDPWTEKARQRAKDIGLVLSERPVEYEREQEAMELLKEVAKQKEIARKDNKELAKILFEKALLHYEKQDEVTALKEAIDAHTLDPSNQEIEKFIEKVQTRLLTR